MAAFSYKQHFHPFLIDSSSNTMTLPTQTNIYNSNKMFGFNFEQPIANNTLQPYFSHHDQFYNPRGVDVVVDPLGREVSNSVLNNSCTTTTTATTTTTTTSSCSNNNSSSGEQINNKITTATTINPMDHNKRKLNYDATSSAAQSMESGEVVAAVVKGKKPRKMRNTSSNNNSAEEMKNSSVHDKKEEDESKSNKNKKKLKNMKAAAQSSEEEEATPSGYVHVRARRGQATDSHSLAERVRREKISERMKLLQTLVPGCDKVTGKALMLDEIINYVQSLQNQVEFLSMKLASFNPMFYDFGVDMEAFMVKPEQADVQECSRNQSTTNAYTATPNNNYPLPDSSTLLLLQQGQMPSILPQSNGLLLWDTDEVQRQRITSQSSGFSINNLPSFH